MSVYISVELQRKVRTHFSDRCAYCQTAEALTVAIFEIEHIIPRSAQGRTIFETCAWPAPPVIVTRPTVKNRLTPLVMKWFPYFIPIFKVGQITLPGMKRLQRLSV